MQENIDTYNIVSKLYVLTHTKLLNGKEELLKVMPVLYLAGGETLLVAG